LKAGDMLLEWIKLSVKTLNFSVASHRHFLAHINRT